MSRSVRSILSFAVCALAACAEQGEPARATLVLPAQGLDEGAEGPADLLALDLEDHPVHGPDAAVSFPPDDFGAAGSGDQRPSSPRDGGVHDAGATDASQPVVDAEVTPDPDLDPDAGGDGVTISLGLCDLLASLICADGLECIEGACTEPLACAVDGSCDLKCSQPSACAVDCDGANNCKADCGDSTRCDVSCIGTNNCEPKCKPGGSCEIDCTAANNCDHVKCEGDAECLMHCGGETNCRFDRCAEPRRCTGDILVCNRACPPGSEELGEEEDD